MDLQKRSIAECRDKIVAVEEALANVRSVLSSICEETYSTVLGAPGEGFPTVPDIPGEGFVHGTFVKEGPQIEAPDIRTPEATRSGMTDVSVSPDETYKILPSKLNLSTPSERGVSPQVATETRLGQQPPDQVMLHMKTIMRLDIPDEPDSKSHVKIDIDKAMVLYPLSIRGCNFRIPILHPESTMVLSWVMLGAIFVFYEMFSIPVIIAFDIDFQEHEHLFIVASTINVYYILDIILINFKGYISRDSTLVMDPVKILRYNYRHPQIIFDFLSAIPWEWIVHGVPVLRLAKIRFVRAARGMFRFLKLFRAARHVVTGKTNMSPWTREFSYKTVKHLYLFKMVLLMTLFIHWLSCAWIFAGLTSLDAGAKTNWMDKYMYNADKDRSYSEHLYIYGWSVYFILTTMTTVGYGDMSPTNFTEACFAMVLLLSSAMVFAVLTGHIIDIVHDFRRTTRWVNWKRAELTRYLDWRKVSPKLRHSLLSYFFRQWEENRGLEEAEANIMSEVSPMLKEELCFHIYGGVLNSAQFLSWMNRYSGCVRMLATMVKSLFLFTGDIIFAKGDANVEIFMLLRGSVKISTERRQELAYHEGGPMKKTKTKTLGRQGSLELPRQDAHREGMPTKTVNFVRQASAFFRGGLAKGDSGSLEHQYSTPSLNLFKHAETAFEDARRVVKLHDQAACGSITPGNSDRSTADLLQGELHAPAYFGESCLWTAFEQWDTCPSLWPYSGKCATFAEFVVIPRSGIQKVINCFTPWLKARFDIFHEAVTTSLGEDAADVAVRSEAMSKKNLLSNPDFVSI